MPFGYAWALLGSALVSLGIGVLVWPRRRVPGARPFILLMAISVDVAPIAFSINGAFLSVSLFRFKLFDLVPAGYSLVVASMGDGMIIFAEPGRIVDINPIAAKIIAPRCLALRICVCWAASATGQSKTQMVGFQAEVVIANQPLQEYCGHVSKSTMFPKVPYREPAEAFRQ